METMDFNALREALRLARESAEVQREGKRKIGMTLDEAAQASGLNRATIHSIENVKREPSLKPELETIERLLTAYQMSFSSFFAQFEGLQLEEIAMQDQRPPNPEQETDDALAALTPTQIQSFFFGLGKAVADYARDREEKRRLHRGQTSVARPQSTGEGDTPRISRPGADVRRAKPRPERRRKE